MPNFPSRSHSGTGYDLSAAQSFGYGWPPWHTETTDRVAAIERKHNRLSMVPILLPVKRAVPGKRINRPPIIERAAGTAAEVPWGRRFRLPSRGDALPGARERA